MHSLQEGSSQHPMHSLKEGSGQHPMHSLQWLSKPAMWNSHLYHQPEHTPLYQCTNSWSVLLYSLFYSVDFIFVNIANKMEFVK